MSGASNSRSKSAIKTKSLTEQIEDTNDEKKDDELESTVLLEALTATPTVIRRYKMPYRNFLRDVKIQMQNKNLSNQELVKIASQRWKIMTYAEKKPYIQEAAFAKEIDAQNQKRSNYQQCARQQATKRKRKCPKCGGYPASTSPSETTNETTTEGGTTRTTESEESEEKDNYSSDTSYYSYTNPSDPQTIETGSPEHDATKSRNNTAQEENQKSPKKRKTEETGDPVKWQC